MHISFYFNLFIFQILVLKNILIYYIRKLFKVKQQKQKFILIAYHDIDNVCEFKTKLVKIQNLNLELDKLKQNLITKIRLIKID